jgi:hypothetical protein
VTARTPGCRPEQVTALVDGALGDATAALERHLSACESCRLQLEAERAVRTRLRALPAPEPPPGFDDRLRAGLPRRASRAGLALRVLLPLAATLVLAFWARGLPSLVAWEIGLDHDHCFAGSADRLHVRSAEASVVSGWLAGQTARPSALPARIGSLPLVGARRCLLIDASFAPHVMYGDGREQLSLFLVSHEARFADLSRHGHGRKSVALVRGPHGVLGIVGSRPEDVDAAVGALRQLLAAR